MYKKIVYLILLLDVSFFYLIPLNKLSMVISNYQKIGISFLIAITLLVYRKMIFQKEKYLFIKEIFFFLLLLMSEFIFSYISYKQGVISILKMSNHFIIIMEYFIICIFIRKYEKGFEEIQKVIVIMTLILSTLFLCQYIMYIFKGNLYLFIDRYRAKSSYRFNGIRIYESAYFIMVGCVISFGNYLKCKEDKKFKWISIITSFLAYIQIIMVSKSRMGLLFVSIALIIMWIIKNTKSMFRLFVSIIISGGIIFLGLRMPIINNYINSINSEDYSLITRSNAIEFYMDQVKVNPIFGTGFIEAIENEESYYLVKGPYGKYYKNDMGIIGVLNIFGIVGVIWYIILILKILKILIITLLKNKAICFIEIYGLFVLIIIGSIVMSPFDNQRIVMLPFFIAFIDHINSKLLIRREL